MRMVLMFILNMTDLVYSHHDILLMLLQQDNIPVPYNTWIDIATWHRKWRTPYEAAKRPIKQCASSFPCMWTLMSKKSSTTSLTEFRFHRFWANHSNLPLMTSTLASSPSSGGKYFRLGGCRVVRLEMPGSTASSADMVPKRIQIECRVLGCAETCSWFSGALFFDARAHWLIQSGFVDVWSDHWPSDS